MGTAAADSVGRCRCDTFRLSLGGVIGTPLSLIAGALLAQPAAAPGVQALAPVLADARGFSRSIDDLIWPGFGSAPFGFLLVEKQGETLLCQPGTPSGFAAGGTDPVTGCALWTRARSGLPDNLLAAMPVLGPPSTIVMGTPEATRRSRGSWIRTVLHEHFHQWQTSLPDYYQRVAALDLAGGDETGMWMLNFPFPYENAAAGRAYAAASTALADALERRGSADFLRYFDLYAAARATFAESVSPRDWRYLDFQLWQEGTARWTEIQLGKIYPDAEVRKTAEALERATLEQLRKPDLAAQKRELAYPLGAGEAMLMSACGPEWRAAYPGTLAHSGLLALARKSCVAASGRADGRRGRAGS